MSMGYKSFKDLNKWLKHKKFPDFGKLSSKTINQQITYARKRCTNSYG